MRATSAQRWGERFLRLAGLAGGCTFAKLVSASVAVFGVAGALASEIPNFKSSDDASGRPGLAMAAAPPQQAAQQPAKPAAKSPARKRSSRARAQQAPSADRIRSIQAALAQAGVYSGNPTGKWDAASIAAMKRFQESRGLAPTGKIDARSLQALGLGSEVAGKSPPRAPASRDSQNP
jgi:peptidoglycan hydrolase-like protein with peptidoglycan-binding domain